MVSLSLRKCIEFRLLGRIVFTLDSNFVSAFFTKDLCKFDVGLGVSRETDVVGNGAGIVHSKDRKFSQGGSDVLKSSESPSDSGIAESRKGLVGNVEPEERLRKLRVIYYQQSTGREVHGKTYVECHVKEASGID